MKSDENVQIGRRVRFVRERLGMDQAEFAQLAGAAAKQNVSTWETGSGRLSLKGARAIRERTGYGLDFLYFGDVNALSPDQIRAWTDWDRSQ